MYGDCQVLSSMGGTGAGEPLFSMPTTMFGSANLNFLANMPFQPQAMFSTLLPKEEMAGSLKSKEEEMESRSGGSGNMDGSCGEDQEGDHQPKKKRYHRHTSKQIQEMESLFKECPHPDEKQRLRLSQELGLKPRQVKFWFQNRRTQMKAQQDRSDNVILRAENESLKSENFRLQAAIRNITCPNCGSPAILGEMSYDEQHLRLENARLREELDRVCSMASRYNSRPLQVMGPAQPQLQPSLDLDIGVYSRNFHESMPSLSTDMMSSVSIPESPVVGLLESEKPLALDLAVTAIEQLSRMSQDGEALWIKMSEGGREVLNLEEYSRAFPWPVTHRQQVGDVRVEASREIALVIMNAANLVGVFLDANKWMEMFPSMLGRARTVQVITPSVGNHASSGSLQLMHAEFQFPSPLVPTRECYFLRFCQQSPDGIWLVVDFPVDGFNDSVQMSFAPVYRRRPSGLLIQDVPNGYSKVTWVEHVEVEDRAVHQTFSQLVLSGSAFGAHRWIANLQRQCDRVASLMSSNTMERDIGVANSVEARRSIMHLAGRMVRLFSISISSAGGQAWTALGSAVDDSVRITTRKSTGPGQPHGVILCGVSSTWLPFSHLQVFELLRCEKRRSQLDVFSGGNTFQEVAHIANGSHPGNCVALLRVNAATNSGSPSAELMVQESFTDASGSMVVYAPIDVAGVNIAMSAEDTSCIPLLPSGFVIVPGGDDNSGSCNINTDNLGASSPAINGGCILTVAFQVLASAVPASKISMSTVTTINNHICNAVRQIHAALATCSSEPAPSSH
ncbi:homeobox-leucine zipper protein ROC3-like [Nymphaea colorata]|nr:homeobox-leucine zipper protein ROC3-like [Nymphaea colorata]XP_031483761.1 homeobox-leucine zipper protein ROC3-like [Nymphaea colorata]XP_031483762.1 homeobox-leucine zipper protein ROC3-like [Nymphaea colorata]XP_049933466.1 homeobox-leucine zipper protein ROC3-like [Nymphaea colorata]